MTTVDVVTDAAMAFVREYVQFTRDRSVYGDGLDFAVIVVWQCCTLGHMKFLITTDLPDGRYYEVTYNGEKREMYLDVYVRVANISQEVRQDA